MKIITKQGTLHTELFQQITRHEQLGIITFSYGYTYVEDNGQGPTYIVQVPMTFTSDRDCLEAFRRYLRARNSDETSVNFMDIQCYWPEEAYEVIHRHKSSRLLEL